MSTSETTATATPPGTVVRVPEHVVYRPFAAETVVLNLKTGKYHGLNATAGVMLETLERLGDVGKAATELAQRLEQPLAEIEADLGQFCSDLAQRGLIELDAAGGNP